MKNVELSTYILRNYLPTKSGFHSVLNHRGFIVIYFSGKKLEMVEIHIPFCVTLMVIKYILID